METNAASGADGEPEAEADAATVAGAKGAAAARPPAAAAMLFGGRRLLSVDTAAGMGVG